MSQLKVNAIRHTGASSDAVTLASDGSCTVKATNNLSNRNLIINGAMNVAQRGATSNAAAAGTFTLDRWKLEHANTNEAPNITQHALTSSDTGPWAKGFRHSLHIENGNQTSADTNDYMIVMQNIEAQNMAESGWDYTSASSYITLSYWVKSSVSQNFYQYLRGRDGTEQLYAWETGTLSANTWTKITKKIPGNSNLQFDNNNGEGLRLTIPVYWGGNWTNNNSLNTWANYDSSNRTPDWASTWYTTNDATFEITGVQLEVGDVATEFEHRSHSDELQRCKRYFQMLANNNNYTGITSYYWTNSHIESMVRYEPEMRTTPTLVQGSGTNYYGIYNNGSRDDFDSFTSLNASDNRGGSLAQNTGVSGTAGMAGGLFINSSSAYISFDAEL